MPRLPLSVEHLLIYGLFTSRNLRKETDPSFFGSAIPQRSWRLCVRHCFERILHYSDARGAFRLIKNRFANLLTRDWMFGEIIATNNGGACLESDATPPASASLDPLARIAAFRNLRRNCLSFNFGNAESALSFRKTEKPTKKGEIIFILCVYKLLAKSLYEPVKCWNGIPPRLRSARPWRARAFALQ